MGSPVGERLEARGKRKEERGKTRAHLWAKREREARRKRRDKENR
jgi:hypothetical protein